MMLRALLSLIFWLALFCGAVAVLIYIVVTILKAAP